MPFRYLRDPLFLSCVMLYAINRFLLKPYFHTGIVGEFIHNSLNDVICIPVWVPVLVWLLRKVGWRASDVPPQASEILVPLLAWSWFFELVLPHVSAFHHLAVGDPDDILCYTIGALIAAVFWKRFYAIPDGRCMV